MHRRLRPSNRLFPKRIGPLAYNASKVFGSVPGVVSAVVFCLVVGVLASLNGVVPQVAFGQEFLNPHDQIGLSQLQAELGRDAPTGEGVVVAMTEAAPNSGWYYIDTEDPLFAGKRFTNRSGENDSPNGHTETVGAIFYGLEGVAPGVRDIDIYMATDWFDRVIMRSDENYKGEPLFERAQVHNHSWVAYRAAAAEADSATRVLRSHDYQVDRDKFVSVVTLQNGKLNDMPELLAHAYNVITVGTSDGDHSGGTTTFDAPGRVKPDIVAPNVFTSFAAPLVSGAAALLVETSASRPELIQARRPQVIKALLMAGATKEEFPAWSRDWFRPLDPNVGVGELHVYNSHSILTNGPPRNGSTNLQAWDYDVVEGADTRSYTLTVPAGYVLRDLSAVLTWHREFRDIDPGDTFEPEPIDADLDLRLRRVGVANPIDESLSRADNVEHIYQKYLGPGTYTLDISADVHRSFGIAWRSTLEPQAKIIGTELSPAGVLVHARGTAGRTYRLETSNDLLSWRPLGQVFFNSEETTIPIDDSNAFEVCRLVPVEE